MEYRLLKMQLYNLPWKKLYESEELEVKKVQIKSIDDNYDDDINYGLYSGDDEAAFYHAYTIYMKLLQLNKNKEKYLKEIDSLQDVLLQDVKNYLTASACLDKNPSENMLQLILMLGEVCCNEKLIDFILKHWEQERESKLEAKINYDWEQGYNMMLDFPVLYRYFGDKVLYETGNMELAIRFYQLEILEWMEPKKVSEWHMNIATYKALKDNDLVNIRLKTNILDIYDCLSFYTKFFELYNKDFLNQEVWLENAEKFAECFEDVVDYIFNTEYKSYYLRDDFRICFILALKIYNEAFLWECLAIMNADVEKEKNLIFNVIEGLKYNNIEIIKSINDNIKNLSRKAITNSPERVYVLLWGAAYVEMIRRILLESDLQNDIGYYTALDTLRFMLPERAGKDMGYLSVMHVAYMNDPNEGKTFWHFIRNKKEIKNNKDYRKILNYPYVFLKCFTTLIDDLPMWEMYGNHAEGCCVIFKKEWFKEKVQVPLYRVCYLRKIGNVYKYCKDDNPNIIHASELEECLHKLNWIYTVLPNNIVIKKCFREITDQVAFLFKDANYQHEQELRIMYWYNEISNDFKHVSMEYPKLFVSPKIHIGIKEIILGPKVRDIQTKVPYLQEELEKMCQKMGYDVPEITLSEIEYQ